MQLSIFRFVFITFAAFVLTACGGGGDSGTSPPEPTRDLIPPVISLNGESAITLDYQDEYIELGATATDDVDGNLNVTITGLVDTSALGDYTVTYSATD